MSAVFQSPCSSSSTPNARRPQHAIISQRGSIADATSGLCFTEILDDKGYRSSDPPPDINSFPIAGFEEFLKHHQLAHDYCDRCSSLPTVAESLQTHLSGEE
jgi:hypothetical protein